MQDEGTSSSTGSAAGTPGAGAGGAGERFSKAKEYVGDKYAAASDTVREQYSALKDKVDDIDFGGMTEQLRSYVRSNPGKALLMSVGVGFVVGLLLRRAGDDDEE